MYFLALVRLVEVRRHAFTKKLGDGRGSGSSLSQAGVELARRVGACLGWFDYVVASDVPRTGETAIAMGFAVNEIVDMGAGVWEEAQAEKGHHHAHWDWGRSAFVRYAELLARGRPTAAIAQRQVEIWMRAITHMPDGAQSLVVSHGGLIEPALVAACPDGDLADWGAAFAHCEGARLTYHANQLVDVELLRISH